jgi:glycosyltransferase involved in cell wall biosynthesis
MTGEMQSNTATIDRKPALGRVKTPVVMQIIPELETGGAEQGTVDVAVALKKYGWKSIVVSHGGAKVTDLQRARVEHVTLPVHSKNPVVIVRNAKRIERLVRADGVDIIHVRSRAPAWSALLAARRTGRPLVTTFHGTYNAGNRLKHLYNSAMVRGDRVIAISNFIADHIRERFHVDDDRLVTVPRGINLERFDPATVTAERMIKLSAEWRLPDGAAVVMLPGRLTRWKGHMVLLEALGEIGRDDVFTIIVGDDQGRTEYRDELEAKIKALKVGDRVRIVDSCQDMPAAYMLAGVVVSASTDPEAFGRVPVEAQAMGRPVVATRHGGARETVDDGKTGWLVRPGDPKALAWGIRVALQMSADERATMAEQARAWVAERFAVDRMCADTLDVYRSLLSDN